MFTAILHTPSAPNYLQSIQNILLLIKRYSGHNKEQWLDAVRLTEQNIQDIYGSSTPFVLEDQLFKLIAPVSEI
jgi:hypothetical protein